MLCADSTSIGAVDTFRSTFISYWFDNLGFITEGNLLLHSSYLPLGVSQRTCELHVSSQFSSTVAGEKRRFCQQVSTSLHQSIFWCWEVQAFCKGSLSLPIFFTLLLSCLVYFYFVLFASWYVSNVSIISDIPWSYYIICHMFNMHFIPFIYVFLD